ncbi:MAG: PepSY domain-containing protein [Hyphomonas sp.]
MKRALAMACIGFALAAPAPFALADDDDDDRGASFRVSRAEAVDIARDYGMARIDEVERDDDGWELEGCTGDRREIEIDIHGWSGEVTELDVDDDDDDDC